MQPSARTTLGYGLVGFVLGAFLLPWFYLWSVRSRTASTEDPMWVWIYVAIVFVPAAVFSVVGWNKTRTGTSPS